MHSMMGGTSVADQMQQSGQRVEQRMQGHVDQFKQHSMTQGGGLFSMSSACSTS